MRERGSKPRRREKGIDRMRGGGQKGREVGGKGKKTRRGRGAERPVGEGVEVMVLGLVQPLAGW